MAIYLGDHLFEAVALLATCAAALNYAVGRSYLDGWAQAAGIPSALFQSDLYEAIFTGVKLRRIWLTVGLVTMLGTAYIWIGAVLPDWWARRRSRATLRSKVSRMRLARGWGQRGLRARFVGAALVARGRIDGDLDRGALPEVLRWRALGPRGQQKLNARSAPWKPPHVMTVVLVMVIALSGTVAGTYKLVQDQLLVPARNDGIRSYAKTYLAVTGHLPYQFGPMTLSVEDQKDWACEGRSILSQFRAVKLLAENGAEHGYETFYVVQGADKIFVLLGEGGSVLRSFGDGPFSLRESAMRPLAKIAQSC